MHPQKSMYTSVTVVITLLVLVNVAFATIYSPAAARGHIHESKQIVSQDKNNMNFSGTTSVLNIINGTSNPNVINNTASTALNASHQNSPLSSTNTHSNDTRHSSLP